MTVFTARPLAALQSALAWLHTPFPLFDRDPVDYPFVASDVAALHRASGPHEAALDQQTWDDLLLERHAGELGRGVSIFGRQALDQRLRAGASDCDGQRARLQELMRDPARLDGLQRDLRALRDAEAEVVAPLFEGERPAPFAWAGRTWTLPLALAVSVAAVALSPLAWLGAGLALYFLISLQVGFYARAEAWTRTVHSLQMLLRACSLLGARGAPCWTASPAGANAPGN